MSTVLGLILLLLNCFLVAQSVHVIKRSADGKYQVMTLNGKDYTLVPNEEFKAIKGQEGFDGPLSDLQSIEAKMSKDRFVQMVRPLCHKTCSFMLRNLFNFACHPREPSCAENCNKICDDPSASFDSIYNTLWPDGPAAVAARKKKFQQMCLDSVDHLIKDEAQRALAVAFCYTGNYFFGSR